jgi:NAD(P)-dependent dehydrogenase (short-subunit alcohol dehydrogenase family)
MAGPGTGATIVTGGTGGLGLGVVRALADAGHDVVVTWIAEREIERFPDDLRGRCRLEKADVTSQESLEALVSSCEPDGVWALVQLVGGYLDDAPVAGMDMEGWDRQFALNTRTVALGLRAALPGMVARGGGRAVAVGTRAALRPFAGASAYAASKAAVLALVTAASEEVKRSGVCVNAVLPSVIDTPANRAANPDTDPAGWVRPDEIGAVIAFLCSAEASAVTGAAIPVYGKA